MQNYDQGMVDFGNSLDVAFPAISGCNGINNHFSNNSAAAQAGQPNIRDDGFICYEPVAPARVFIDNENEQGWEPLPQHHRALQPIDFNSYNGESSNAVEYRFDTHHGPQQSQPLYPDVSGQTFNSVFHPNQQSWNQNYTPPVNPQFVCRWCVNTPNSSWTLCYQTFFHLHDLVVHLRTFHIKKEAKATFRCHWDNCQRRDKPFKEKSKLEAHVRTHTGEKPYICKDCKRPFARPENMANHMRIHTGKEWKNNIKSKLAKNTRV